jgi:hypothetical protein
LRLQALVIAVVCLAVPVHRARAQQGDPVAPGGTPLVPGSRVRVHATVFVTPLVANYVEMRADTLVLVEEGAGRGLWSVTLDQVQRIETSIGQRRSYGPLIRRGAVIGAAGGAVGGLLFAASFTPSDTSRKYSRPSTAGLGALAGAVIGGFIGSRFRAEQWVSVPLPRRVSLLPGPRSGLRIAIAF